MPDATYHSGTIYKGQPSSSGQTMYVSTGCAVYDENVATAGSTAAVTFKNHGFSVISSTHPNTVAAPVKGAVKEFLFRGTTKAMKLKASSGVVFNSSHDDVLTVTLGSTKTKNIGVGCKLFGVSATKWWAVMGGTTDVTVTLTTST